MAQNSRVSTVRGFILQASYRIVSGTGGQRIPVVQLFGRLEGGGTFLVRDDRQRPHFFIRAADAERARALRAPEPQAVSKRTFDGAPAGLIEAEVPADIPGIRDRLEAAGIDTFEADVRFAVRYLIDRGIKGGCEIDGRGRCGSRRELDIRQPLAASRRGHGRAARTVRSISRRTAHASGCSRFHCMRRASTTCSSWTAANARCRRAQRAARMSSRHSTHFANPYGASIPTC